MAVQITAAMQNQVAQNYIAILGRNPDPQGFSFWVNQLADANNTASAQTAIVNGFGNSQEFRSTYASLSTSAAVTLLYQNVLLRAPDAGGLTYWTGIANGLIASGQTLTNAYAQTAAAIIYNASSNGSSDSASVNSRTATAVASGTATPTTTYTLTTNIDTFGNAAQTSQQIFNAANTTFTSLDNLTGGTATNDTLNVAVTGAYATPTGATVTNVDIINVTSSLGGTISTAAGTAFTGVRALNVVTAAAAMTVTAAGTTAVTVSNATPGGAAATTVNGGSTVSATVTGAVADTIIIGTTTAATGAVTASLTTATTAATGGVVTVTGGTTVAVTSLVSNTATGAGVQAVTGTVTVTGNASTTAVTVNQSAGVTGAAAVLNVANTSNAVAATRGVTNGVVTINDANAGSTTAAATITTVTLQNYGASTISSNALTTLNLSATGGAAGTLAVTYGLTTGNPTALALNLGGGSLGVLTLNGTALATVNAALTANTTLAGITDTALRTVNLSGTGILTLTATNTAITSIVNTSAAAGLNANVSALTGLTSLNFASTSANNTITLNAATQSYVGGTGNDIVTIGADALVAITGGNGTDTIALSATAATYTNANYRTNVTGFETLRVTNVAGGTYNMTTFTGFSNIQVSSAGSTNAFSNVVAGTGLQLLTNTVSVTYTLAGTNGAASTVNVGLNGTAVDANLGGGTAGFTTGILVLRDANAVGVGTVNINSDASVFGGAHVINTLTDNALSNLNITGTGSLSIGAIATGQTALTISDNATGITANSGVTDGIVVLTGTNDILGQINFSGTHAFTIGTLTDNVPNLTLANANTGTSGVLTVGTHTAAALTSLTLTGSVALTGVYANAGAMTISGATDNSIVNITATGAGVKTITLGNGANILVTGAGNDVITVGTGGNTITAAAGGDVVTLGAGTASSAIVYSAVAQTIQGAVTSGTTALTAAAGADRVIGAIAGDTINLTAWGTGLFTAGALSTTINAGGAAIDIVRGNWVAATGIFTSSATGTDSIVQWDTDGVGVAGVIETVVLVGFVNTASTTTTAGLITLA